VLLLETDLAYAEFKEDLTLLGQNLGYKISGGGTYSQFNMGDLNRLWSEDGV
jgi:hypothetical protein